MVGAPQGAMRVTSQIWQVVFASQTLEVFCLALRKKAQYVVVNDDLLDLGLESVTQSCKINEYGGQHSRISKGLSWIRATTCLV
jgi:hypothetical protein